VFTIKNESSVPCTFNVTQIGITSEYMKSFISSIERINEDGEESKLSEASGLKKEENGS
jgi:hypothetical protein